MLKKTPLEMAVNDRTRELIIVYSSPPYKVYYFIILIKLIKNKAFKGRLRMDGHKRCN